MYYTCNDQNKTSAVNITFYDEIVKALHLKNKQDAPYYYSCSLLYWRFQLVQKGKEKKKSCEYQKGRNEAVIIHRLLAIQKTQNTEK